MRPLPISRPMVADRSRFSFCLLVGGLTLLLAVFVALGFWQVERRAWKLALIAAVATRVNASPAPAPGPREWPVIKRHGDGFAYRHVSACGRFLNDRAAFVQAVTDRGAGFWLMVPISTTRGYALLVNRGYVADRRAPALTGRRCVTGLLRLSEPGGAFLQSNDPAHDRWYSRDVPAIAARHGLGVVAPYFIDADAASSGPGAVGGLTVIAFRNNHLAYAATWFALAALSGYAIWAAVRRRASDR